MKQSAMLVMLLSAAIAYPVAAQSSKPRANILKSSDLTESALVDALVPAPTTRGFSREPGGRPAARPKTGQSGQASLLIEFETNSTQLTPEAKQQLDVVGRALNTSKLTE